jgi:putative transposase
MAAVQQLETLGHPRTAACAAMGVARATRYRRTAASGPSQGATRRPHPASLTPVERAGVLAELTSERFCDVAIPEVHATLLDEGKYLCSTSTMYRILNAAQLLRERRRQVSRVHYPRPELLATAPNQVWSWDITKLKGPEKWSYFHLYVILDIFSRLVVGWMIAYRERSDLARDLIAACCTREGVARGQLTLHADRGSSMQSKPVAHLLVDLGVTKSHSRPHVSDDNPFSESNFKTLKHRPDFPERFGSIADARAFCQDFFRWYNNEHRHAGIGMLTPSMLHGGEGAAVLAARHRVMATAYAANPQRFNGHVPKPQQLPTEVWINKPMVVEGSKAM